MLNLFWWNFLWMINMIDLLAASGIFQNSVFGMAAKLPFKYTGAVILGSNISGTFTSIVYILTKTYTSSVRTAAIYYFIGAIFVLLACFDTYFALPLNVCNKHCMISMFSFYLLLKMILHSFIKTEILSIQWIDAWKRSGKSSKIRWINQSSTILVRF